MNQEQSDVELVAKSKDEEEVKQTQQQVAKGSVTPPTFVEACDSGDLAAVEEFVKKHSAAELVEMRDSFGWTGLHYAARSGHQAIAKLLLDHGFPVDVQDGSGSTPLYRAVGFGHNVLVYYLVERGADCLHKNNQGDNMIHNSAWAGNAELTLFFLEKGVNPLWKNKTNRISLQDITEKLPEVAFMLFDKRRRVISSYLLEVQVEYDFDGIDDLDDYKTMESTPLEIILQEGHLDLVAHPLIRTLLKWKWQAFGKRLYLIKLFTYLLILGLYSYVAISVMTNNRVLSQYTETVDYVRAAFEIVVLLFAIFELYGEIKEFRGGGRAFVEVDDANILLQIPLRLFFKKAVNPMLVTAKCVSVPRYMFDGWNYVDITTYTFIIVAAVIRAITAFGAAAIVPDAEMQIMASITCLLYLKLLSMLGAHRSIGPLIRCILRMTIDYFQWLVVYAVFLMGFSIAFFLFLASPDFLSFSNYGYSILTTFRIMIGDFAWDEMTDRNSRPLFQILLLIYFLACNIMMLNLLIAMFGNTYSLVRYVSEKEWLMEWANLIMRFQRSLGKKKVKKILDGFLAQQRKDNIGIQNFTPTARVVQSKKFCRWEPKSAQVPKAELDIQYLREELLTKMTSHFASLKEDNVELAAKLVSLQTEFNQLKAKSSA